MGLGIRLSGANHHRRHVIEDQVLWYAIEKTPSRFQPRDYFLGRLLPHRRGVLSPTKFRKDIPAQGQRCTFLFLGFRKWKDSIRLVYFRMLGSHLAS